jgi:hypothetical protein
MGFGMNKGTILRLFLLMWIDSIRESEREENN